MGICDPYYGTVSLLRLDLLKHCSPIEFLTKNADPRETDILPRALREWKREHGAVEFREYSGEDLYDRHILSSAELVFIGDGLKDLGNKESLIIKIPSSLSPHIVESVRSMFEEKWERANTIA
jgi:hypothetical protein